MHPVADQIRCTFQPIEPTLVLAAAAGENEAVWVNVAKEGDYWHPTFKEFGLSAADFTEMVKTFKAGIYPESPAELPCDYDHRSLRAKTPEDGKAAGWVKDLETRDNGTTLWAQVEFTPPALIALQNKEWRFLSGVFAPKWRTFRKKDLGPTFLGLGITNYPTLHNLPAIALSGAVVPMHQSDRFAESLALADLSFDDKRQRLQDAVRSRYSGGIDGEWVWIQSVYDDYLVVQKGSKSFKLTYSISDDGVVTLSDEAVEVIVQFQPIAASRSPKEPSMAGKKTEEQTVTVKNAEGQDVIIPLSALANVDAVLALGRSGAPDPASVVARQDFDQLGETVKALSTQLDEERTKREAAEKAQMELSVDMRIKDALRNGEILPKEEADMRELALNNRPFFDRFLANRGKVVALGVERGSGSPAKTDAGGYAGASDSIRAKAEEYAAAHKVPFAEAVIAVSTTAASDAVADRAIALRREHAL